MLGYEQKNGDIRLQLFNEIEDVRCHVGKAERRQTNSHKGRMMNYLRGKYDMIVVKANQGHNLLRLYELNIQGSQLLGYRLRTFFYNLFH